MGIQASAATTIAAAPMNSAVPRRVPPRLSVPATSWPAPSAPSAPPTPPPAASPQSPSASPTRSPAPAARTSVAMRSARVAASTPARRTPIATPSPADTPIQYQLPTVLSVVSAARRPGRQHGLLPRSPNQEEARERRKAPARVLLLGAFRARAKDGEPARTPRAEGARAPARDAGRRRRAAAARTPFRRVRRADARPRQGQARRRPDRRARECAGDRVDAQAAPRDSRGGLTGKPIRRVARRSNASPGASAPAPGLLVLEDYASSLQMTLSPNSPARAA